MRSAGIHEDLSPAHETFLDQSYFFNYRINYTCMRYNKNPYGVSVDDVTISVNHFAWRYGRRHPVVIALYSYRTNVGKGAGLSTTKYFWPSRTCFARRNPPCPENSTKIELQGDPFQESRNKIFWHFNKETLLCRFTQSLRRGRYVSRRFDMEDSALWWGRLDSRV